MTDILLSEKRDGVLLLTLNRPAKKNAANMALWLGLAEALDHARDDRDVHVVVIAGSGGNFCAGADLSEPGAGAAAKNGEDAPFEVCAKSMARFDKPLLAAVSGVAIGGGATLTFHCDLVYVADSLRMRLPFVSLGMVPEFASSYLLQANIGAQRAAELLFSAQWIDAQNAVSSGIAAAQFSDDEVLERTMAKAAEMAQWPVNALRETKRCLKLPHQQAIAAALEIEREGMNKQVGSPENLEAFSAFLEKRKPNFRGL